MRPHGELQPAPKSLTLLPDGCTLDEDDFQSRAAQWAALRVYLRSVDQPFDDARVLLRFEKATGVAEAVRGLAAMERQCCSGATFSVDESPEEVSLEVSGDPAVVAAFNTFRQSLQG